MYYLTLEVPEQRGQKPLQEIFLGGLAPTKKINRSRSSPMVCCTSNRNLKQPNSIPNKRFITKTNSLTNKSERYSTRKKKKVILYVRVLFD